MPKRVKKSSAAFWDSEYKNAKHLALSMNPSEDLEKFTRFLERRFGREQLNPLASVADLGCGNGRNLLYLAETFGMRGVGYDISHSAIATARQAAAALPLSFEARPISGPLSLADESQTLVLDMMTSHFLSQPERLALRAECARILKHGGWLFLKTFLLDDDSHAKRLIAEHPAAEAGSYVHPVMGVAEHAFTEDEIRNELDPYFIIHKIQRSHGHRGRGGKRRSMSVYAEKR